MQKHDSNQICKQLNCPGLIRLKTLVYANTCKYICICMYVCVYLYDPSRRRIADPSSILNDTLVHSVIVKPRTKSNMYLFGPQHLCIRPKNYVSGNFMYQTKILTVCMFETAG